MSSSVVDRESKSGVNHNIYRGLYPIREVKQYYRRDFVNGKALYICLWANCTFKTWKYSQHIARHIHLKHIGIKELKCEEANCAKTFKRPESLVQHQKNHLCGFGIDSLKMKDPNNVCGVKNIKKYYFRELDNDYYVFGCKWNGCEFVTNNSGSIRRHVHNQHLCPHSVANTNPSHSSDDYPNISLESVNEDNNASNSSSDMAMGMGVAVPLIEIIELDSQSYIPNVDQTNDNPFAISAKPVNEIEFGETEMEAKGSSGRPYTGGLYSLKDYSDLYRKVRIDGEIHFKCNCNRFTTKSQISLVRHIWTDIGRTSFDCDINGCSAQFDNEFSLYKHKKSEHNYESNSFATTDEQNVSNNSCSDVSEIASNSGLNDMNDIIPVPQSVGNYTNGKNSMNNMNNIKTNMNQNSQNSDGIYSLKNLNQYFSKRLVDNEVVYECKCGQFKTSSTVSLAKHIWVHKGIKPFECDLCSAQFDSETSLHKHKQFYHISDNSDIFHNFSSLPINTNFDNNYANNSGFNEESISSTENNGEDSNCVETSKPKGFKRSLESDRNNSGLYSLKNYGNYYKKVVTNEEVSYKCTNCGFASRSQVSLIRHIWSHTGKRFECDIQTCNESFSSETELYRHRKSHYSQTSIPVLTQPPMTSTPNTFNYSSMDANAVNNTNMSTSAAMAVQRSNRTPSNSSQIRKIMESKSERGLYSLKKYENYYKKVQSVDGFKFVCNCGQFQTRSQATLVRHIWEHQSSEGTNESNIESNPFEYLSHTSNEFEMTANDRTDAKDSQSFADELNEECYEEDIDEDVDEDIEEQDVEEGVEEDIEENEGPISTGSAIISESRRSLTFKKYRNLANNEMIEPIEGQNGSAKSAEDQQMNSLIVSIEDRGYFCQWADCDYSDERRESVVSHIRGTHMNRENNILETTLNYDNNGMDGKYSSESEPEPEQSSSKPMATYSIEDFASLMGQEYRDNKLKYLCKATDCSFETALNSAIISHIQENHIQLDLLQEYSDPNLNHFECTYDYCNASFPSFESLVEHKKIHSKQMLMNSDYFEDSMEDDIQQNSSNSSNSNNKSVKSWKNYTYNGKASAQNADKYSDSVMQKDGSYLYTCKWNNCGYQSPIRGNIIRHIRRHTGDKPFICQIDGCGRRFAYSTDVKLHQQKNH